MSHVAILQMIADDGSSPIANDAMDAIERLAAQSLALHSADQRIQALESQIAQLNDENTSLRSSLNNQKLEHICGQTAHTSGNHQKDHRLL